MARVLLLPQIELLGVDQYRSVSLDGRNVSGAVGCFEQVHEHLHAALGEIDVIEMGGAFLGGGWVAGPSRGGIAVSIVGIEAEKREGGC